jgi:hypothetical protein
MGKLDVTITGSSQFMNDKGNLNEPHQKSNQSPDAPTQIPYLASTAPTCPGPIYLPTDVSGTPVA